MNNQVYVNQSDSNHNIVNQNPEEVEIAEGPDDQQGDNTSPEGKKKKGYNIKALARKGEEIFQKGQQIYNKGAEFLKKNEAIINKVQKGKQVYNNVVISKRFRPEWLEKSRQGRLLRINFRSSESQYE